MNPARILVVDDDEAIIKLVSMSLSMLYVVQGESNAAAVLTSAVNFKPDLVIMDVVMPAATGPDLARRMREIPELSHVPVLFITGSVDIMAVPPPVLMKPFRYDELLETVASILAGRSVPAVV